jgi:hypothetical protein
VLRKALLACPKSNAAIVPRAFESSFQLRVIAMSFPALKLSLLETLFAGVWRCRGSFDNPTLLRFRANPLADCVQLQRQSGRMKDSREESCPV